MDSKRLAIATQRAAQIRAAIPAWEQFIGRAFTTGYDLAAGDDTGVWWIAPGVEVMWELRQLQQDPAHLDRVGEAFAKLLNAHADATFVGTGAFTYVEWATLRDQARRRYQLT